ncbi:hypothetical protein [Enterococcus sp.]|uniref:hypothetical protein n=1 Tax=Enterococcus sp. TaxID=35783 RepID=UPI0028A9F65B|nr:hypothetical protein [Enterococcus sp.]
MNTIIVSLAILPVVLQLLMLLFLMQSRQPRTRGIKILFWAMSILNGVTAMFVAFLLGYLADERLIASSSYMLIPVLATGLAAIATLLKV